jgi:DNA-binding NarL/FixJ family response regulator
MTMERKLSNTDLVLGQFLAAGLTYKEMAQRLTVPESTVRIWMRKLRQAFQSKNSVELAIKLYKNGYLQ